MIQFTTPNEAQNAYRSPQVLFDNRFVKVFWASPEHIQELSTPDPSPAPEAPLTPAQLLQKKQTDLRKQKDALIEKQLQDQKSLMEKLEDKSLCLEDRNHIMGLLKNISTETQTLLNASSIQLPKPTTPTVDPLLLAKLEALKQEVKLYFYYFIIFRPSHLAYHIQTHL